MRISPPVRTAHETAGQDSDVQRHRRDDEEVWYAVLRYRNRVQGVAQRNCVAQIQAKAGASAGFTIRVCTHIMNCSRGIAPAADYCLEPGTKSMLTILLLTPARNLGPLTSSTEKRGKLWRSA